MTFNKDLYVPEMEDLPDFELPGNLHTYFTVKCRETIQNLLECNKGKLSGSKISSLPLKLSFSNFWQRSNYFE